MSALLCYDVYRCTCVAPRECVRKNAREYNGQQHFGRTLTNVYTRTNMRSVAARSYDFVMVCLGMLKSTCDHITLLTKLPLDEPIHISFRTDTCQRYQLLILICFAEGRRCSHCIRPRPRGAVTVDVIEFILWGCVGC